MKRFFCYWQEVAVRYTLFRCFFSTTKENCVLWTKKHQVECLKLNEEYNFLMYESRCIVYVCGVAFFFLFSYNLEEHKYNNNHAMPHSYRHYHNHSSVIEIEDEWVTDDNYNSSNIHKGECVFYRPHTLWNIYIWTLVCESEVLSWI